MHCHVKLEPIISVREVTCAPPAHLPRVEVQALDLHEGGITVLAGNADSGHALLLRLLGLIARPDRGEVVFAGEPTQALSDEKRAELRTMRCGYVFASPFMMPSLTVLENLAMPMFKICGMSPDQARARAEELLQFTGLDEFAKAGDLPVALQFRAAVARALAHGPNAVFVEDLDRIAADTGEEAFIEFLAAAAHRFSVAIIGAAGRRTTESAGLRCVEMVGGRIVEETQS
jgi:lipoprotein-releasing system ATP-binding protein